MPIDFPNSPTNGQTFTSGSRTWQYSTSTQLWDILNYGDTGPGGWIFGNGTDGDVTVSGSVTLTRDMNYNNLTINAGSSIRTNGYHIRVFGTLNLSSAPANAIHNNGNNGGNSTSATGGSGAGGVGAQWQVVIRSASGNAGATGGTGNGAAGGVGANYLGYASATTAQSGAGGAGSGGRTGGAAGASSNINLDFLNWTIHGASFIVPAGSGGVPSNATIGTYTAGGAAGGGDGTNSGGGGGGGGGAGGGVYIAANVINRGTNNTANIIQSLGGAGGNGRTQTVGNVGGGGGGAGGSGGVVTIFYRYLLGTAITNAINVTGGTGGNGGNGVGTGAAGNGGGGGNGGFILVHNVNNGTTTYLGPTPGLNARTGGVTAGVAATTWRATL